MITEDLTKLNNPTMDKWDVSFWFLKIKMVSISFGLLVSQHMTSDDVMSKGVHGKGRCTKLRMSLWKKEFLEKRLELFLP